MQEIWFCSACSLQNVSCRWVCMGCNESTGSARMLVRLLQQCGQKSANCRRTEYPPFLLFQSAVSRTSPEQQQSTWFQAVLCKSFKEDCVNVFIKWKALSVVLHDETGIYIFTIKHYIFRSNSERFSRYKLFWWRGTFVRHWAPPLHWSLVLAFANVTSTLFPVTSKKVNWSSQN